MGVVIGVVHFRRLQPGAVVYVKVNFCSEKKTVFCRNRVVVVVVVVVQRAANESLVVPVALP
jgi:hypothetical protein